MALTKAKACFSIMLYFRGASLRVLLKKAIGFSNPWSFFYSKTATMVCSEANEKINKYFLKPRLIKTGVLVKACFVDSTVHFRINSFFSMLFSSLMISAKFEINLLKKLILAKKYCNSMIFLGGWMFRISSILADQF